jgi:hypothetical protein
MVFFQLVGVDQKGMSSSIGCCAGAGRCAGAWRGAAAGACCPSCRGSNSEQITRSLPGSRGAAVQQDEWAVVALHHRADVHVAVFGLPLAVGVTAGFDCDVVFFRDCHVMVLD